MKIVPLILVALLSATTFASEKPAPPTAHSARHTEGWKLRPDARFLRGAGAAPGWLKQHGYDEQLAQCVHTPSVENFLSPFENHRIPWVVLHEPADAFNNQTIGFDDLRVSAAWNVFPDSGKYESVLTSPGALREHCGLTDQKECFIEMVAAYFGPTDTHPCVTGEGK